MTYYFTYGIGDPAETGQAYQGGWTEVEAPSRYKAIKAYQAFYQNTKNGVLPCCSVALEADQMGKMLETGNGGAFCHDRIVIDREVMQV